MLPVTPRSTDGQALQQSPPQGERHYPKRSGNQGTAFVSLLAPCAPTCAWLPRTPACWMILHRPSSAWRLSTAGRTIGNMVRCLHDCCWPLFLGQSVHVPGRLTRPCRVSCPGYPDSPIQQPTQHEQVARPQETPQAIGIKENRRI